MSQSPAAAKALAVSNQLRNSAKGIALGRAIFDGNADISSASITTALRALGLDIPKSVVVTKDVAQIVMAGGSFYDAASTGVEEIGAFINPVAAVVDGVFDIFKVCGLLDPDSMASTWVRVGTEAALVVSSGGLNVFADIALAVDVVINVLFPPDERPKVHAELKNDVQLAGYEWLQYREGIEKTRAGKMFTDYQNGNVSVFQMLAGVAQGAPDLFLNYYPDFNGFIPPVTDSLTISESKPANHGGFLGIGRQTEIVTESKTFSWQSIGKLNDAQLQQVFIDRYILKPFEPYRVIANMVKSQVVQYGSPRDNANPVFPRIHLADLAVLSLFPPYFQFVGPKFNLGGFFAGLGITPHDLGYTIIEDQFERGYEVPISAPISFNGVDYFDSRTYAEDKQIVGRNAMRESLSAADERGDIGTLTANADARAILAEFGQMPNMPNRTITGWDLSPTDPKSYRNIRNFWSACSMAEKMRNDPFFKSMDFSRINSLFPVADWLTTRHKQIQFLSITRSMNMKARANIAKFFGIPLGKLVMQPVLPGKPAAVNKQLSGVK